MMQVKDDPSDQPRGIDRLLDKYRERFRIPENLDHYSEADFHEAERQYLRFCLTNGSC